MRIIEPGNITHAERLDFNFACGYGELGMEADFDKAWAGLPSRVKQCQPVQIAYWRLLLLLRRYDQALQAADEYPGQDEPWPWLAKVEVWRKQGRHDESHKLAGLLYEAFPMNAHCVMALAKAEKDRGNKRRSRVLHRMAVAIDPRCKNSAWFKS